MAPSAGSRKAVKVVPVIPRSLSRRQPEKPAAVARAQKTSPAVKDDDQLLAKRRHDSLVRDPGPLIAATPVPTTAPSASSSNHELSSDHHDGTSSNSDFSITASRKDTPISTVSGFSGPVHSTKASISTKPHDSAHASSNSSPNHSAGPASDGDRHYNGHGNAQPQTARDIATSSQRSDPFIQAPASRTNHQIASHPPETHDHPSISPRHGQEHDDSMQSINGPPARIQPMPDPRRMWPRERVNAIQPFAPNRTSPRDMTAPPLVYHNHHPAVSIDMAQPWYPPINGLSQDPLSRPQSRNRQSQHVDFQFNDNIINHTPNDFQSPATPFDNVGPLDWHLHRLFASQEFADVIVEILPPTNGSSAARLLYLHAAILSRSPRLHDMLSSTKPDATGKRTVQIQAVTYYKSVQACIDTLWCLYGYDVSTINLAAFWQRYEGLAASEGPRAASIASMNELASAVATAHYLGLDANAHAWIDMVPKVITADNASLALEFALRAGLDRSWLYNSDARSKSALDQASYFCRSSPPGSEPYSTMLLHTVLDFFGAHISPDFLPDTTAPPIFAIDRFPLALIPRVSQASQAPRNTSSEPVADPRFHKLRLGEFPVNDGHVELLNKTISSALFSLPFPALKTFLEDPRLLHRMGNAFVATLMQAVIVERERRRHAAVEASFLLEPVHAAKVLNEQLRYDLGIIEAVEKGQAPAHNGEGMHGPLGPGRQPALSHRLVCRHVPVIFP